jgi:hypothetical protein
MSREAIENLWENLCEEHYFFYDWIIRLINKRLGCCFEFNIKEAFDAYIDSKEIHEDILKHETLLKKYETLLKKNRKS